MLCLWVSRMGPLFFNRSWTMFCRVWIVRMYILMILLLVPPMRRMSSYWLTTTATCVPCWMGYEKRSWLLRLAKPISLFVWLSFVPNCWKMAHAGRRQGKCWRWNVRKSRILFGSSWGSWGSQTIIRAMSKTTPP